MSRRFGDARFVGDASFAAACLGDARVAGDASFADARLGDGFSREPHGPGLGSALPALGDFCWLLGDFCQP